MSRAFRVSLGEHAVGLLFEDESGRVTFRFHDRYRQLESRPVLSQSFEDDLEKMYRGKRGELPAFFANLIPEGPLRELIESSLEIPAGDDLALLAAVGQDLPGAVEIVPDPTAAPESPDVETEEPENGRRNGEGEESELRFSLAGVQMKFSVHREAEKIALPVHGRRGDWILKLDSARFPGLVRNEFVMLEWARSAGFDVPECHLQSVDSLAPALRPYAPPESEIFVIRRYDRDGDRRIHQEDFAQVVGVPPRLKYDNVSYEQCALLVQQLAGEEAYFEFVRRLAFVVASGNNDAHLKNWSLIYPDGVNARLSPLYDQVCTVVWEELPRKLSLNLSGRKNLLQISEDSFLRLTAAAGTDGDRTLSVLREALERFADAWRNLPARDLLPAGHQEALKDFWAQSPLLRRYF